MPIDPEVFLRLEFLFPHDLNEIGKLKGDYSGIALGIPGLWREGSPIIHYDKGLLILTGISKKDPKRKDYYKEKIKRAIKSKIAKKQISKEKYDGGMLVIKIPYNLKIKNSKDLEKMKNDFEEFGKVALNEIRCSSRYKAVLIISSEIMVKNKKGKIILRGFLIEKESIGFNRRYFQVPINIGDYPKIT